MNIRIRSLNHKGTGEDAEAVITGIEEVSVELRNSALESGLKHVLKFLFDADCEITID